MPTAFDNSKPTIGVVVPLFNKAATARRAVRSILNQTVAAAAIVIVDDGSTDRSAAIIGAMNESRIQFIQQQNAGVSAARNRGIAELNTELVAFLDADDEWEPDHLDAISLLRRRCPDCDVLGSGYVVRTTVGEDRPPITRRDLIDSSGRVPNYFALASRSDPPICSSSVVVSRNALSAIGGFPNGVGQGEDLLTWARLAAQFKVAITLKPTAVIWQSEFPAAIPTRRPEADDRVGLALKQLLLDVRSEEAAALRSYIAVWHKMRGSMFLALGDRRQALYEFRTAQSFAFDRAVMIKKCMTLLPAAVSNRAIEMWRAGMRKPRPRTANSEQHRERRQ